MLFECIDMYISCSLFRHVVLCSGMLFEWTLMLHGTKKSPYIGQKVDMKRHSKLAVVKREHESSANFHF